MKHFRYENILKETSLELNIPPNTVKKVVSSFLEYTQNELTKLHEEPLYIKGFCKFSLNNKTMNKMFNYGSTKGAAYIKSSNRFRDYDNWYRYDSNNVISTYLNQFEDKHGKLNTINLNKLK